MISHKDIQRISSLRQIVVSCAEQDELKRLTDKKLLPIELERQLGGPCNLVELIWLMAYKCNKQQMAELINSVERILQADLTAWREILAGINEVKL